ncbi:MAG: hypothetical protein KA408_07945 [Flavobacteriales bacterium]|nr:hypothetical protein [Flavobacteriales bacterium]
MKQGFDSPTGYWQNAAFLTGVRECGVFIALVQIDLLMALDRINGASEDTIHRPLYVHAASYTLHCVLLAFHPFCTRATRVSLAVVLIKASWRAGTQK